MQETNPRLRNSKRIKTQPLETKSQNQQPKTKKKTDQKLILKPQ